MTLREYLAAKAMQGLLANPNCPVQFHDIAREAWDIADVMLEEKDVDR